MADRTSISTHFAKPQAAIAALVVWIALNGVALFVFVRRLSGLSPLRFSSLQIGVAATSFASLGLLSCIVARYGRTPQSTVWRIIGVALPVVPLLLLTGTATADRLTFASLYAGALAVFVTAVLLKWDEIRHEFRGVIDPNTPNLRALVLPVDSGRSQDFSDKADSSPTESKEGGESGQWLRRFQNVAGHECLEGTAVGEFAAGRKQTVVHIAFCPPFESIPKFTCEASGDGVRARVAAVYPYGVRIELKRTGDCTEPSRVEIEFAATNDGSARAVAA